ncbi:MAG: glycerophosphodiester phosphodiesterase [Candidatus Bathyarchaeota archaeon]|nr:glycerophosphodiester phosphodiesterase [Candidatus Bathyarchaeota archaeon]
MIKVGHRGARAYEPENTLRSFKKALELGVDAVELDVRRTKDDAIVVIHDADVKRAANGKGLVGDLTLKEVQSFATEKEERISTLEEVLDFLDGKVKVFVELKEEGLEEQVLVLVEQKGMKKNVVLVSFLEEALRKVRELDAEVETGLIYVKHTNPIKAALELKAQWLVSLYHFTHTANVQKAHENGLKILVWTVNSKEDAAAMAKKGVDGIASDKPDIL